MIDTNVTCIIGRLTKDPELKYTSSGKAVCSMSIAVNRDYNDKKDVSYFDLIAWGKLGEVCTEYLKKGKRISVSGHLKQNRWETQEGNKRSRVEIVAESVQFLDAREEGTKVTHEGQAENSPKDSGEEVPA